MTSTSTSTPLTTPPPQGLSLALRVLVPIGWMAVIWTLSSVPGAAFPRWTFDALQNAAHIVVFGILSACWYWALAPVSAAPGLWAFLAALIYGGVDELHQAFVPGRVSSVSDLLFDAIGAGLVVVLLMRARHWRRRRSSMDATPARSTRKVSQRSAG